MAGPIVVMGLMGSGKSTLATALAEALDLTMVDSDVDIERAEGRTASEIAKADGADALHELEAQQLLDRLAGPPAVLAAAASTIEVPRCRDALREAFVVWIDTDTDVLVERFASGPHRPNFSTVVDMLREQALRRRPLFAEVADVVVDGTHPTPAQVRSVLETLGSEGGRAAR